MTTRISGAMSSYVDVKCKLCGADMAFNVNDPASFLSRTEHQDFFGMMLVTYRIEHIVNGEKHLNAVLIDQQNLFRGYIDAYKIPILEKKELLGYGDFNNYLLLENEIETLNSNKIFTNFFVVSYSGWILEVVKNSGINSDAFLKSIFEKIEETRSIYTSIPQPLNVVIANLECFIWIEGRTHIIITTNRKNVISKFGKLMKQITQSIDSDIIIPKKKIFRILIALFLKTDLAEKRPDIAIRLLTDDLYYSRIRIRYPDRIMDIIPRISERHSISIDILENLLLGKTTFIELLEQQPELISQCKQIIETLDFINRRNLLV